MQKHTAGDGFRAPNGHTQPKVNLDLGVREQLKVALGFLFAQLKQDPIFIEKGRSEKQRILLCETR